MEIFPLTIAEYADQAATTDKYLPTQRLQCCALGLISEVGEFAGKVDKHYRKTTEFNPTDDERHHMAKELGDILWFATESLRCTTSSTSLTAGVHALTAAASSPAGAPALTAAASSPAGASAPTAETSPASISQGRVTPAQDTPVPDASPSGTMSPITLPSLIRHRAEEILFAISNRPPSFDLDTFMGFQQVIMLSHTCTTLKRGIVGLVFSMSTFVNEYIAFAHNAIANGDYVFDRVDSEIVSDYLSDLIAAIAECAILLGYTLEDIARINIQKLADRNRRDQIASIEGGDDR